MADVIDIGMIYIGCLLKLGTMRMKKSSLKSLVLPLGYAFENEILTIRNTVFSAEPQSIYTFELFSRFSYCVVCLDEELVLIGPYREGTMSEKQAKLIFDKIGGDFERYKKLYYSRPFIEKETVILAACVLLYQYNKRTDEIDGITQRRIDFTYNDNNKIHNKVNIDENRIIDDLFVELSECVSRGDVIAALDLYERIEKTYFHDFGIYGDDVLFAEISEILTISMIDAGIPPVVARAASEKFGTKDYKGDEMHAVLRRMVYESCGFVKVFVRKRLSPIVNAAMDLVEQEFRSPLTVKYIAERVGVSVSGLSIQFKKECGVPLTTYINQKRLKETTFLLVNTKLNVSEICSAVGFSDSNYLARIFKKKFGLSPTEYRKLTTKRDFLEKRIYD